MFIDYYQVLDISENATLTEIKIAFKNQAIKWHPDKNPQVDTTLQMQRVNEAYLILKDPEAREKFNTEYQLFKRFKEDRDINLSSKVDQDIDKKYSFDYTSYVFSDSTLEKWMDNARKQAIDLATQTIQDFKGMLTVGLKEGAKATGHAFVTQIMISIVILLVIVMAKACKN